MSLDARVALDVGALRLSVHLQAEGSEVVAVVGPNGAGKTTLLRALAGLAQIADGHVELDGVVLDDTSTGVHLPPESRAVGVVFQDYLLFPHLSALDNVAYGLRSRGVPRGRARQDAMTFLERVGVADHAGHRPGQLSGGQAQRVALARALATHPALLLLDEPLAAIDLSARAALRRDLRNHLAGAEGVRIVVTHDPRDAMAMADRLVVLEDGGITQSGTLPDVTARPRSPWVAQMVGLNLYRGAMAGGVMTLPGGHRVHVASGVTGSAFALVHPRGVSLHRHRPEGSPRNAWLGEVGGIDFEGDRVRVEVRGPALVVAEVTPQASSDLRLSDGGPIWVAIKATDVEVYAA
ncbi:MAG: ABC transporter ATP-binding protein [Candidatus Dormibacteraeota bacterium]|nr:ABC transporter ATP-binding protein [Candidatus Dormibacteraeota bacterium]